MDPNFAEEWNETKELHFKTEYPIHRACRDGDCNYLYDLFNRNSINKNHLLLEDDYYGWIPAHYAAYFGKLDCQKLLLDSALFNELNLSNIKAAKSSQTCAHLAAFGNNPQCLMHLLQGGSDPNAQDFTEETPLHKAAKIGSLECVTLMLKHNANFRSVNNQGQSASILARDNKHQHIAELLFSLQNKDCVAENRNVNTSSNGYYGFHLTHAASLDEGMDMDTCNPEIVTNSNGFSNQNVFAHTNGLGPSHSHNNFSEKISGHFTGVGQSNGFGPSNGHSNGFGPSNGYNTGFGSSNGNNTGFGLTNSQSSGFDPSNGHSNGFGSTNGHSTGFSSTNGHSNGFAPSNGHSNGFGEIQRVNQSNGPPMNVFKPNEISFSNGSINNISVGGRKRSMEVESDAPECKRVRMKEPAFGTLTQTNNEPKICKDTNEIIPSVEIEMDTSVPTVNKNPAYSQPPSSTGSGSGYVWNTSPISNNHTHPLGFRTYCTKSLRSHFF